MSIEQQVAEKKLQARVNELEAALREILKGEGTFSLDHKQHAINTIENMKTLARTALNGGGE